MAYQTFDGQSGDSKSDEKLQRIQFPKSLEGKAVVDLGCNEGFFCFEAKKRGAARVLGIDHDPKAIAIAKQRAADMGLDIEFRCGKMTDMPDGKFDYVLLLSAIHYIDEPAILLQDIHTVLNDDGILILELGLARRQQSTMIGRALRSIDDRFFATEELLRGTWLKNYAARDMGASVAQAGDPIARRVFHCTPEKTSVMFIAGKGGIGKTSLAWRLPGAVVISTDQLFKPERSDRPKVPAAQTLYDASFDQTGSIWATWEMIKDKEGVHPYFVDVLTHAIKQCAGANLIAVEGFILDSLVADVQKSLGSRYSCWICRRT